MKNTEPPLSFSSAYLTKLLQYFLQKVTTSLSLGRNDSPPIPSTGLSCLEWKKRGRRRPLRLVLYFYTFCYRASLPYRGLSSLDLRFHVNCPPEFHGRSRVRASLRVNICCLLPVLCESLTPRFPVETTTAFPFLSAARYKVLAKAVKQDSCTSRFFFIDLLISRLFSVHSSPNNL